MDNAFYQLYEDQMIATLKIKYPNLNEKALRKTLKNKFEKNFNDKIITLYNSFTGKMSECSLFKLMNSYFDLENPNRPILTGNGCFYKQHHLVKNFMIDLIDDLLNERKVLKKLMLDYENTCKELSRKYDVDQSLVKVNSIFGVFGEGSSYFYDDNCGESITYTGAIMSTTAIVSFEAMMANNLYINDINDFYFYINRTLTEQNDLNILKFLDDDSIINLKTVVSYFYKKIHNKSENDKKRIKEFLMNLSKEDLLRVYYKNNLIEFLENSKITVKLFKKMCDDTITSKKKDKLYNILKNFIYLTNYFIPSRQYIIEEKKRQAVIVCDTDSNFIYMDNLYKYFIRKFNYENNDKTVVNIITKLAEILDNFISKVFKEICTNMNVNEKYHHRIHMKNEFIFSRVMLTDSKRNYATRTLSKEGVLLDKPKIDIKGLQIKKVSTVKTVRDKFKSILKVLLESPELNLMDVYKGFEELEKDILKSLKLGEIDYLVPSNLSDTTSYKKPYTIAAIKGMLFWNALNPYDVINPPTNVRLLNITKNPKLTAKLIAMEEYKPIADLLSSNKELSKYGFEYLALPSSIEKIPEWLIPFIDYDSMVIRHIKTGLVLLESCNIMSLKSSSKKLLTNIVSIG